MQDHGDVPIRTGLPANSPDKIARLFPVDLVVGRACAVEVYLSGSIGPKPIVHAIPDSFFSHRRLARLNRRKVPILEKIKWGGEYPWKRRYGCSAPEKKHFDMQQWANRLLVKHASTVGLSRNKTKKVLTVGWRGIERPKLASLLVFYTCFSIDAKPA
jgi:hypothetical protein